MVGSLLDSKEGLAVSIGLFVLGVFFLLVFKKTNISSNVTVKFQLTALGWISLILSVIAGALNTVLLLEHKF